MVERQYFLIERRSLLSSANGEKNIKNDLSLVSESLAIKSFKRLELNNISDYSKK